MMGAWRATGLHVRVADGDHSLPRLMAPKMGDGPRKVQSDSGITALTWSFLVERVTRIELALSAWESDRTTPPGGLTWQFECPLLTVTDPWLPGLMVRQWPGDLESQDWSAIRVWAASGWPAGLGRALFSTRHARWHLGRGARSRRPA